MQEELPLANTQEQKKSTNPKKKLAKMKFQWKNMAHRIQNCCHPKKVLFPKNTKSNKKKSKKHKMCGESSSLALNFDLLTYVFTYDTIIKKLQMRRIYMIKYAYDIANNEPFRIIDGEPERTACDMVPISEQSYMFIRNQIKSLNACEPTTFEYTLHVAIINGELEKYGV